MSHELDAFQTAGSSPPADHAPDLLVHDGRNVFLVYALSPAGQAWLAEHVSADGLRFGSALVVEHRYIDDIVRGALDAGLGVETR